MSLTLLIIGAGGIGGYYAARLLSAGHEVVLTARGEHLKAIQGRGLRVDYEGGQFHHPVKAYNHEDLVRAFYPDHFDLVLIALKSTATESVMDELAGWLETGAVPVLSLQNGVDNELLIADVIGTQRVLGGLAVRIGGHIVAPGVVTAEGVAQIVMGAWPYVAPDDDPRTTLLQRLEQAFCDAGIPSIVSADIRRELWRKLVINNGVNPLSALTGLDTRTLTHHPELSRIVYGMMAETVQSAKADGVNLVRKDLDEMFDLISNFNAIKTSMLVDREKGRPLELDSISGAVLRRCRVLGIEAPYTATVHTLLSLAG
ncbi:ketopantoate reductase ApbA/PanE [Marinobacter lipolyticus SM19]|uniref:2-dehydropantoate 2-reductase n=1 Tax=Marinobacter lipolyticus SM19 TaxID=1318628 RepID=R8B3I5_9GAMM|nr:2-dehydropantoate 2-reductase [Marinobacter lipolyticus]EON93168.1 ketopantoate reductase ApbA/PanE [Marinobacter lipolyticus SM19]